MTSMDEPILEQIAEWIAGAIDGMQDPAGTLTLRAVRPKILDWEVGDFKHGDCIIESHGSKTQSQTSDSRVELGTWAIHGVVRDLPAGTAADTVLARMAETIRRLILSGNSKGRAAGGMARSVDCPEVAYGLVNGGVVAEVAVEVEYETSPHDGYG